jgi:hypothetical protein
MSDLFFYVKQMAPVRAKLVDGFLGSAHLKAGTVRRKNLNPAYMADSFLPVGGFLSPAISSDRYDVGFRVHDVDPLDIVTRRDGYPYVSRFFALD